MTCFDVLATLDPQERIVILVDGLIGYDGTVMNIPDELYCLYRDIKPTQINFKEGLIVIFL